MSPTTSTHQKSTTRRERYARDAVHEEFRGKSMSLARGGDFRDRRPWQSPVHLDEVAAGIVGQLHHGRPA